MISSVETELSRVRSQHRAALDRRLEEIYSRLPELREVDTARTALLTAAGKGALTPAEARDRHRELTAREDALLASAGYTRKDLELTYDCEKCRDTGWLGAGLKKPCSCRLLKAAALDPAQAINRFETFEAFDASLYTEERQRAKAEAARDYCLAFAEALPHPEKPFLLLLGDTGVGKSFFGNAIAYRALERAVPAARLTAYAWLNRVLRDMRAEQTETDFAATAPLLSLDDLGSEPHIPNVTDEHLFALINERLSAKRPTVIGTNLSLAELRDRYGDRVFTRLTDKANVQVFRLEGENLRRRNRSC